MFTTNPFCYFGETRNDSLQITGHISIMGGGEYIVNKLGNMLGEG